jgi:hypothetical protein
MSFGIWRVTGGKVQLNGVSATARGLVFIMEGYIVTGLWLKREDPVDFRIKLCKVHMHYLFEVFMFSIPK